MICKNCGAHFEDNLPECPYCGEFHYAGAQKEYMGKLENLKENLDDLHETVPEMYTKEFNPETTILEDWFNLTSGLIHYNEIFDKYEITHALLRNDELVNLYIKNDPKWNEIYQDDMFSIYERVEN